MIANQDFQIKCTDLKIKFKKPALEYELSLIQSF